MASAVYAYVATDAGDLALQPGDRVRVLEQMNNDSPVSGPMSYGNMPLAVAQGSVATPPPAAAPAAPVDQGHPQQAEEQSLGSKIGEGGIKVGKKLGDAAIFGAGSTMGANLVNSIF
ncbi:hypothetical protein KEM52_003315 [Ascosphaera acerosa]|nr:hypothetical protein KEM52_003315 [Ascosphaera acerosa]